MFIVYTEYSDEVNCSRYNTLQDAMKKANMCVKYGNAKTAQIYETAINANENWAITVDPYTIIEEFGSYRTTAPNTVGTLQQLLIGNLL